MGDISKDINSKFPNERVKALINIKYTANWLNTVGNEILKPSKISNQQYNILRILKGANEAVTVNSVKERMIEKSPNATRLMDKLCDKGLIERTRCENDRRVVYVKISEKGLKLLDKIKIEELGNQMNSITEEEAKTLNEILDKIR
ncbi:MAG: MarR family transcriptional regulator [Bacteroidetes bacterium HGW-Bacteroidetes-3]|jgi:DNA-binding MarR family transcriptional regulator|nr:MAG: MarR family transcriptional regulator [Bacteroidetes bacterium HGW-Bacteroidetes-3]